MGLKCPKKPHNARSVVPSTLTPNFSVPTQVVPENKCGQRKAWRPWAEFTELKDIRFGSGQVKKEGSHVQVCWTWLRIFAAEPKSGILLRWSALICDLWPPALTPTLWANEGFFLHKICHLIIKILISWSKPIAWLTRYNLRLSKWKQITLIWKY